MKGVYLDTSVVLTRYAPSDPYHAAVTTLFEAVEGQEVTAATSTLTLVELASSVARAYEKFVKEEKIEIPKEKLVAAYTKRVAKIPNLQLFTVDGEVGVQLNGVLIKLPLLFARALEIAPRTSLKSLDNLHLAAANLALKILGLKIDYLVTQDDEMLKRRGEIRRIIEIPVASPNEIVELEGLSTV